MDAPKQYEIATLHDFLNVPPDRLSACLAEFSVMLDHLRAVRSAMLEGLPPDLPDTAVRAALPMVDRFTWIDDDEPCVREVVLRVKLAPEPVAEPEPSYGVEWVDPQDTEGGHA